MDRETLSAYDSDAAVFAQDWHDQPPPSDLHVIVQNYFIKGITADIGCGSGRDTAWLTTNGFPAQGFDASDGLLEEARRRYPHLTFSHAELPGLPEIASASFDNVLCETVIMHLGHGDITPATRRLLDILRPGGILYLSWRVTPAVDQRDKHGRLYAAFNAALVRAPLSATTLLLDEEVVSASSGKIIHRLVAKKPG
ncbi:MULTISPECIES: class I SAM-dependent methyltransferase [unclassified Beijerinckia]|uniref:class I SAM-dependent methyltransferase n=1 Tax=unclassified Beijerinckia TaxID=2638183 RepID=UPI00089D698A|nr:MULTISPECIES: class I SAM-dependent methyltransferase [unclassified Beijerinckia]MDH7795020.1 SAM-dependent methyltransferase [Beijerinckia sp. GAS462]SEB84380.1 Methyltransferase domain-containing protein [Beijerinckia sp. 28-YEA-48]